MIIKPGDDPGHVSSAFTNLSLPQTLGMKILIIGGVAGGASTAARLRRLDEQAEIVIMEKGEYISYANCGLPYYIGNVIRERNQLFLHSAESFKSRFNIDVRTQTEALSILPERKIVIAKDLASGEEYLERYDKLVLSPGAEPVRPAFEGVNLPGIFTLRNVPDTDRIKAFAQQFPNGKAVVVGAGFIGLEMAENLHHLGMEVTIVELAGQVLSPLDFPIAAIVQQHIRSNGVDLRLGTSVAGFEQINGRLKVYLKEEDPLDADLVILSIGVKPDTNLAKAAGLKTGKAGGIKVNDFLQTSDPNIYAVGDAIEFESPISGQPITSSLAGPANKQGRICANNIIRGNRIKYTGSINTAIVKIFDMTVGTAGMASKHLDNAHVKHLVSTTHTGSNASYYPGAAQMSIQLVFSPDNGRLFGVQIAGFKGVDKRLDVLSSVVQRRSTIFELTEFEHAYAPPFSSAKDPVNIAGYVAENILEKQMHLFYWNEIRDVEAEDLVLDVRKVEEFKAGSIEGAINIPVDELRNRIDELPRNKKIFVYCQVGLRGYLAYRILKQYNFEQVFNLSGGYLLYKSCAEEMSSLSRASTSNLLL